VNTDPSRILLIRPSALGDVCRTTPVLVSLRTRYPEAKIDWLVRDRFVDAVRGHPALTGVVPFPRDAMRRWLSPTGARSIAVFLRTLRQPRYDLVIDCQGLARSAVFSLATRAPRRLGDARASEFAWVGANVRINTDPSAHVVDRALQIVAAAGAPPIADSRLYTPGDISLDETRLASASYAVLAPTSAWPGKCWPVERFATLAQRLLGDSLVESVVFVGAPAERDQAYAALDLCKDDQRIVDLVGATSVGQLMRLIENAALVVANDSATMHIAVGFDRPLVALLGPTDAPLAGPYHRPDAVAQVVTPADRLSHRACKDAAYGSTLMRRISVDLALETASKQLQRSGADDATTTPPTSTRIAIA